MTATKDEFYIHLRVGDGAATLCVRGDNVGVAFCSPQENFSRKIGRAISSGRAAAGATLSFKVPPRTMRAEGESAPDFIVRVFSGWLEGIPVAIAPRWLVRSGLAPRVRYWSDDPKRALPPWYVK